MQQDPPILRPGGEHPRWGSHQGALGQACPPSPWIFAGQPLWCGQQGLGTPRDCLPQQLLGLIPSVTELGGLILNHLSNQLVGIKTLPCLLQLRPATRHRPLPCLGSASCQGRLLRTDLPRDPLHNQGRLRVEAPFFKGGGRKTLPPTLSGGAAPSTPWQDNSSSNGHRDPPAGSFGAEKSTPPAVSRGPCRRHRLGESPLWEAPPGGPGPPKDAGGNGAGSALEESAALSPEGSWGSLSWPLLLSPALLHYPSPRSSPL